MQPSGRTYLGLPIATLRLGQRGSHQPAYERLQCCSNVSVCIVARVRRRQEGCYLQHRVRTDTIGKCHFAQSRKGGQTARLPCEGGVQQCTFLPRLRAKAEWLTYSTTITEDQAKLCQIGTNNWSKMHGFKPVSISDFTLIGVIH